jgi:hypothetical protein
MRLATTIVQPRLALLRRAAVRAFSSGGSEVRASVPLASSLASPLPAAEGSGGVTTNGSSGAPATEAGHVYRKGARAVFDMPPIKDTIELTAEEAALFKELLEATKQAGAAAVGGLLALLEAACGHRHARPRRGGAANAACGETSSRPPLAAPPACRFRCPALASRQKGQLRRPACPPATPPTLPCC